LPKYYTYQIHKHDYTKELSGRFIKHNSSY
jgi:hypothetical protein